MADQQRQDEAFADDMALIERLISGLRLHHLHRRPGDSETVLEVGDLENSRVLAARHGLFTFETTDRGKRSIEAVFGILRMQRRLPRIRLNRLAPACVIEQGPTAFNLTWAEGQASFPTGYIGHQHALDFSWVVTAELADIAASYRHPNGEPLFDLSAG